MTQGDDLRKLLAAGAKAWNTWRKEHEGQTIDLSGMDLSEMDLSGFNLAELNLSNSDLYRANLSKANLKMSRLDGAELSYATLEQTGAYKANLSGAHLLEANLQNADLSEVDFSAADLRGALLKDSNLQGAVLKGAQLKESNLEGVSLIDADITDVDLSFAKLGKANLTGMRYGGFRKMRGHYFGIRGLDDTFGNAIFVRDAKDQDYLDTMEVEINRLPDGFRRHLAKFLFRSWSLIDYGRSLAKVGLYAFVIATLYGFLYSLDMILSWKLMNYSSSSQSWFTPFYYSVVTYTTLGFGDVTAASWLGEMIVISEVIVGYFTLGLLLSILANTIARRS